MKNIDIAVISLTHGHTRKYFPVLKTMPGVNWIAVSEEDEIILNDVADRWEVPNRFVDYKEMLEKTPEIAAVIICSPNSQHYEQTIYAAKRGKHILSMKILDMDPLRAGEMIKVCRANNVVLQVELELHHNPVILAAKKMVEEGEIGEIRAVNATNLTLSPAGTFPWQGSPELSYGRLVHLKENDHRYRGGALTDHPHIFDLLRWFTKSEIDEVTAVAGRNIRNWLLVEDNMQIIGKMKNGIQFSLDPSWNQLEDTITTPSEGWEVSPKRVNVTLDIFGTKGSIFLDGFSPNLYHVKQPLRRYTVRFAMYNEWEGLVEAFREAILYDKPVPAGGEEGLACINAMNASYESVSTGQAVKIREGE